MTIHEDRTPYTPGQPDPTQPDWTDYRTYVEQPPPTPPKKHTARNVVLATTGAIVLLAVTIGAFGSGADNQPKPTASSATTTPDSNWPPAEPTLEPEPAAAAMLTKADVTLKVKITQQKCYGYGAGCTVTYRVTAGWPDGIVSDGDNYLVTYEVWPVDNGPQVNSLTITDNTHYEANGDEDADTPRRMKSLKVKVTGVEKVGI